MDVVTAKSKPYIHFLFYVTSIMNRTKKVRPILTDRPDGYLKSFMSDCSDLGRLIPAGITDLLLVDLV